VSVRFVVVRVEWSPEDLVGSWTLVDEDWRPVDNKSGPTRLGFALLLKFFELEARFPSSASGYRQPRCCTSPSRWQSSRPL